MKLDSKYQNADAALLAPYWESPPFGPVGRLSGKARKAIWTKSISTTAKIATPTFVKISRTGFLSEEPFYEPSIHTANAILEVLSRPTFEGISSGIPQCYHVKSKIGLQGRVINKVGLFSPDLVTLRTKCNFPETEALHWANSLYVIEVKQFDNSLCDGTIYLLVDRLRRVCNDFFRIRP